mgnify:CR=1 FL=1
MTKKKKYDIINAPINVIIISIIAKSNTLIECMPSLETPNISLYSEKIHMILIHNTYIIYNIKYKI